MDLASSPGFCSKDQQKIYDVWLSIADSDADGRVTGNDAFKFFVMSNLSRPELKLIPLSSVTSIIDGLKKLYIEKLKPLEVIYRFNDFVSSLLTNSDFDAKPMVMLLGQYSTAKTTFTKHLLRISYSGAHIGPEPTTDRFVVLMVRREFHLPAGDFPDINHLREVLSGYGIDRLEKLKLKTIQAVDEMLGYDIPELKNFSNPYD